MSYKNLQTHHSKRIHVAAAQIISGKGPDFTLPRIHALSKAASLLGAELILFSELSVIGYDEEMTLEWVQQQAQPINGPIAQTLSQISQDNQIIVSAGFLERENGQIYNTHLVCFPSGETIKQQKHAITEIEKHAGISPGPFERTFFFVNGIKCAILICADTGIEKMPEYLQKNQVMLRLIPTGGGGKIQEMVHQKDLVDPLIKEKYCENRKRVFLPEPLDPNFPRWQSAFVSANALGPAGKNTCHQGHCIIVDGQGILRAQAPGTIVLEHMHEQLINAILSWE